MSMSDPIYGVPRKIISLKILKVFKAKTKPTLCEVTYEDKEKRKFIFKSGDNLTRDMYVESIFFIFNQLWERSCLLVKPFIPTYRVFPSQNLTGFVEVNIIMSFLLYCLLLLLPPTTNHQPPTTSHQPPATSHQPPATSHQPPATSHQPLQQHFSVSHPRCNSFSNLGLLVPFKYNGYNKNTTQHATIATIGQKKSFPKFR
eukprot:TRINITY_DN5883_c0_g5_i7.p1 TRINITY_DN5883_c0_g5~~TRINITY_DN5883_c0_g5_i7.p1  ORF type:complete len:201 (-),score=29.34 TRINITY_DN5883_c0_g5_i7:141-743(-)